MSLLEFQQPQLKIMVSSVVCEFRKERKAIKNHLEDNFPCRVYLSEGWGSDSVSSEKACIDIAQGCDYFILLIGEQYGNPPSGYSKSVTEMEFEAARQANPYKVRAYLKKTNKVASRQKEFITRVRDYTDGMCCPPFDTLYKLKAMILKDACVYRMSDISGVVPPQENYIPPHFTEFDDQKKAKAYLAENKLQKGSDIKVEVFVENQRTYLKQKVEKATPNQLAKSLIEKLSDDEILNLYIIDCGNILSMRKFLKELFPSINWTSYETQMKARGILSKQDNLLHVAPNIRKQLDKNDELRQKAHEKWVVVLEPLSEYYDIALGLCLHYLALGRFSELIECAHSIVLSVEESWVAEQSNMMLTKIKSSHLTKKLNTHDRILLLDAIGVFQCYEGNYLKALSVFKAMLKLSRKENDRWGIEQALFHCGLSSAYNGNDRWSEYYYGKAVVLYKADKNDYMLGRALNNLSRIQMSYDLNKATKTLEQSVYYLKRCGDEEGLSASYGGFGVQAASNDDHQEALKWFRRAERVAKKYHNQRGLAEVFYNQAISLGEMGNLSKAIALGKKARAIAEILKQKDLLILVLQIEAQHYYQNNDLKNALPLYLRLYTLFSETVDIEGTILALSNVSVIELELGKYKTALQHIRLAKSKSKSIKTRDWLSKCIYNHVAILKVQGKYRLAEGVFKREMKFADDIEDHNLKANIAENYALFLIETEQPVSKIVNTWEIAITSAAKQNNIFKKVELLQEQFVWASDASLHSITVDALKQLLQTTKGKREFKEDYIEALNEQASIYQDQKLYQAAEKIYKIVFAIIQKGFDSSIQAPVLNNYAELLRKIGKPEKALIIYRQAIDHCEKCNDLDGQLLTKHNMALALEAQGKQIEAESILKKVRDVSLKKGLWERHAIAWLGLADLSYADNKRKLALRRYAKARVICKNNGLVLILLEIILTEARLLQDLGQIKSAVSLLGLYRNRFIESEYCLELFLELGICQLINNKPMKAIGILEEGLEILPELHDESTKALMYSALVEGYIKIGQVRKAHFRIKKALSFDFIPEVKAGMLTDFILLVGEHEVRKSNHGKQMHKLFSILKDLAEAHGNDSWVIVAYQELGAHLWEIDHETASQSYVVCLIKALENEDDDKFCEIGIAYYQKALQLGLEEGINSLGALISKTDRWLEKQFTQNSCSDDTNELIGLTNRFHWPIELAIKVLERPDKGRHLKDHEMEMLFEKVFEE